MTWDQMQRLLMHRATLDRVDRTGLLKAALDALDERTLARAHRPHQVQHLPALLPFERGRVKVAHELRDGALDAKELVGEEVVNLHLLVLIEPLGARIVSVLDVAR